MTNWLTFKQASAKYGIAASLLREWKLAGYIAFSTIGDVVMLEERSLVRYVDLYKEEERRADSTARLIAEKERQREMILSTLTDEVFLLETQRFYQPLFHVLVQELGGLIDNDRQREIFLAIAGSEPLSRVAQRYGLSYDETRRTYESIFKELGEDAAQIPLFFRFLRTRFKKPAGGSGNPMDISLEKVIPPRAARILEAEKNITTVYELLQFASTCGWPDLLRLKGMGRGTFNSILQLMEDAHYITCKDRKRDVSPEISIFVQ